MSETPEQRARLQIDALLGPADYILFVDGKALDIVDIVRKEFGKRNGFCKKVTYRASGKSEEINKAFRTALVS